MTTFLKSQIRWILLKRRGIIKLANKKICKDLANCINECIKQNKFPNELKIADIAPIFKKENLLDKTNYRPISILPTVSKIFERILFNQP